MAMTEVTQNFAADRVVMVAPQSAGINLRVRSRYHHMRRGIGTHLNKAKVTKRLVHHWR
jgi:hypothetical protein